MATMDDDGGLGAEVSSRLDELFGEDESSSATSSAAVSPRKTNASSDAAAVRKSADSSVSASSADDDKSPIKNLKALVFGIDWEINDEAMLAFLKETKLLQKKYANDKILLMFLKLHESIGKYIKARKAKAHPDAIKFVTSVFKSFEKVLMTPGMTELQKKRLLSGEVKKFKDFKERILSREQAIGEAEIIEAEPAMATEARGNAPDRAKPALSLDSQEAINYIIEELRKTIKTEFHTILQIIKNLGA